MSKQVFTSWGRVQHIKQEVAPLVSRYDRLPPLPEQTHSFLPFGNGRSYGDSCLNLGGATLKARTLDRFIAFDPSSGILICEAGVLLSEILSLVVPQGWFLPVTREHVSSQLAAPSQMMFMAKIIMLPAPLAITFANWSYCARMDNA